MSVADSLATASFGEAHFGQARLGDVRRTRCLVDLADRLHRHPQGSLPMKFRDPKALRRCYDLMNTDAVTHADVLRPHAERTARLLLEQEGTVLLVHDPTELDFTGHTALYPQLGQIGNGFRRGYLCHHSLAVLPGQGGVLGLLGQHLHVRADAPPGETPAQRREREDRESLLWLHGARAAADVVGRVARRRRRAGLPEGPRVVDVCDRGGDTFEFLDLEDALRRSFVVRSNQDRTARVGHDGEAPPVRLHGYLRTLPEQGRRAITVHGRDGKPDRQATVAVAWAAVRLPPPRQRRGHWRGVTLAVWALRVWEVGDVPAGAEAVEWFLLTNVAVASAEDAWERVDWYCGRWAVEELHKAQKTGCDLEAPQFTTAEALQPMIALLSVVAVSLLQLRDRSRDATQAARPAAEVVPAEEVAVLSGWRHGERRELTVGEFYQALARLGGHQGRRRDKPAGWLVLWRGWQALQLMVAGARAVHSSPAAASPGATSAQRPQRKRQNE
jgi:Transposase DNA-binding